MEKIDLREIEKIETGNIVKNPDWFYHGTSFEYVADILKNGILAKKYLSYAVPDFGLNGKHYICIAHDAEEYHPEDKIYWYKLKGPLMILDHLEDVIKCKKNPLYRRLKYTSLPFRYSNWDGEYQVYDKISPEKLVGIECMVYEWVKEDNSFLLRNLREILEKMQKLEIDLPVYDFSRQEDDRVHELDKEAFLELSEQLTDPQTSKTLSYH